MSGYVPPDIPIPEPAAAGIALARGDQGPQGYQGFQGWQGPQGERGFQGVQGFQGYTGPTGYQGWQGPTGPQGEQGYQGIQGPQGPSGYQGWQGPQGITGPQGFKGDTGNDGIDGPQGPQGVQGPQGWQGPQGSTGAQGDQGIPGIKLAATINLTMSSLVVLLSGELILESGYTGTLNINYGGNINYLSITSTNIGQPTFITYLIKTAAGNPFGASNGTFSIIYPSAASCKGGYNSNDVAIYIGPINSGSVLLTPTDTALSSPHVIIKIYT